MEGTVIKMGSVRGFPPPSSVSEPARAALNTPAPPPTDYPALEDTDAWLQLIAQGDAAVLQMIENKFPVAVEEKNVDGVHVYVVEPESKEVADAPIYLDMHGGALISGGGAVCQLMTSMSVMKTRMVTWGVDYRMAPMHPYPAGPDDCLTVYRALLALRDPSEIFVGGTSAGGNLAAALIIRARDAGLPMPAGLVLLSPELDLTESGDSFQTLEGLDRIASLMPVNLLYANGHALDDPCVSPLFADVTGFPPTFLQSGTRDLFLSNTVRMHRKLRNAGVEAELHVFEAMPHVGFGSDTPEDLDVAAEIQRFLEKYSSTA